MSSNEESSLKAVAAKLRELADQTEAAGESIVTKRRDYWRRVQREFRARRKQSTAQCAEQREEENECS